MHKNIVPYIKQSLYIDELPEPCEIAIYGSGQISEGLMEEIGQRNIKVKYFLDTFENATYKGFNVYKYDDGENYNVDYVLISSMHWEKIFQTTKHRANFKIYLPQGNYKLCIVNHDKKVIYIKNPRAASTTIREMMIAEGAMQEVINIEAERYKSYFKFSSVKHPIHRFLSTYNGVILQRQKIIAKGGDKPAHHNGPDLQPILDDLYIKTFEDFIDRYLALPAPLIDLHFQTQDRIIGPRINHTIKCENLHQGIRELSTTHGILNEATLPHIHKSKYQKDLKIPEGYLDKLYQYLKKDFDRFNYQVEEFNHGTIGY